MWTWKCGELKLYFYQPAGAFKKKKKREKYCSCGRIWAGLATAVTENVSKVSGKVSRLDSVAVGSPVIPSDASLPCLSSWSCLLLHSCRYNRRVRTTNKHQKHVFQELPGSRKHVGVTADAPERARGPFRRSFLFGTRLGEAPLTRYPRSCSTPFFQCVLVEKGIPGSADTSEHAAENGVRHRHLDTREQHGNEGIKQYTDTAHATAACASTRCQKKHNPQG